MTKTYVKTPEVYDTYSESRIVDGEVYEYTDCNFDEVGDVDRLIKVHVGDTPILCTLKGCAHLNNYNSEEEYNWVQCTVDGKPL